MEKKMNKNKIREILLLCVHNASFGAAVITFILMLLIGLGLLYNKRFEISQFVINYDFQKILEYVVFYPVAEELIFRVFLLKILINKTKYGNLIQAILFGIIHLELLKLPYTIISGIVYGNVRMKPNPFWVSILLHSIFNLITMIVYKPFIVIMEKILHLENLQMITLMIAFIPPLILFIWTLKILNREFYKKGLYKAVV